MVGGKFLNTANTYNVRAQSGLDLSINLDFKLCTKTWKVRMLNFLIIIVGILNYGVTNLKVAAKNKLTHMKLVFLKRCYWKTPDSPRTCKDFFLGPLRICE